MWFFGVNNFRMEKRREAEGRPGRRLARGAGGAYR
jgi:hypothetical protein